jgi:hypothetical protein
MSRRMLLLAAVASMAFAQFFTVWLSALASNPALWFVGGVAVVLTLVESSVDEAAMLTWVTLAGCAAPVIVALDDPDAVFGVALSGVFVWGAAELLTMARTARRLDPDTPSVPQARLDALALVAAIGVAATVVVAAVALVDADGGLVLVGLGVVAAGAYRSFVRRFGGSPT